MEPRVETISVIASGPSAAAVDLARAGGYLIGVNDAALHCLRPVDAVVSMDRLWTEHRWDWLVHRCGPTWLRRSAVQNVKDRWDELNVFDCDHLASVFSCVPGHLNGTNSGACALNLAYRLKPRRVFLIGFDMKRDVPRARAYWHAPHEWADPRGSTTNGKYSEWSRQFGWAAQAFRSAGIDVFNVSPSSAIADFPKITPKQYLQELSR